MCSQRQPEKYSKLEIIECVSFSQELTNAIVRSCEGLAKEASSPQGKYQQYLGKEMQPTRSDYQEGFQVIAKPPGQTNSCLTSLSRWVLPFLCALTLRVDPVAHPLRKCAEREVGNVSLIAHKLQNHPEWGSEVLCLQALWAVSYSAGVCLPLLLLTHQPCLGEAAQLIYVVVVVRDS